MSMLSMAQSGLSYLTSHPMFVLKAARNAAGLRLTVPIDLLRWAIDQRPRGKGPERIEISSLPPALGIGLTVDLYGTKIDVSSTITIEAIENLSDALRVSLRVRDLQVKAPPNSPAAMMVSSLDLRRPGSLMSMMPKKHAMLVEATDDLFVLDLLKVRSLAENRTLRRVLGAMTDALTIKRISTEGEHVVIGLRVDPLALPSALLRLR